MKEYEVKFIAEITTRVDAENKEDAEDIAYDDFSNLLPLEFDVNETKTVSVEMTEDLDEDEENEKYLKREYERNLL